RGVNYVVSDSLMSTDIETPNFIRRLSDSAVRCEGCSGVTLVVSAVPVCAGPCET
ncbi:hypothetical protein KUCAC02_000188, partial [Chaenocephalus aceratus]